jgi:hypothetical protein
MTTQQAQQRPTSTPARVKRHVGIAIALLLAGVTSLVVLWGLYQMLLLLVLVAVPRILGGD